MKPMALNLSMTNILYGKQGAGHSVSAHSLAGLVGLHVKCLLHHSGIAARKFMSVIGYVTSSAGGIINNLRGMKQV